MRQKVIGFALLAYLASAGLLSGCATPQLDRLRQSERQGLPERAEVPAVPSDLPTGAQRTSAPLAMTLEWTGLRTTRTDLVSAMEANDVDGTGRTDILAGARRYGRLAVPIYSLHDMLSEIAAGNPILVLQNLGADWLPRWHYAVAIGYDLKTESLTLHSGTGERVTTPLASFERTWARAGYWAVVVTSPNRLSATVTEGNAITAAAGLERSGHSEDAALAFEAIVRRWPNSHIGWIALGNVRFALRDYVNAEGAYRRATGLKPQEPEAWSNLAVALARQGRASEALDLARRAVGMNGGRAERFLATLAEIQQLDSIAPERN